jgi:Family of unknown function (DUF6074)
MSARILPFPLTRRRGFICRHAARMAVLPPTRAERHLAYQLRLQVETMERRGVAADLITAHVRALETAIRCELWRVTILEGGAA